MLFDILAFDRPERADSHVQRHIDQLHALGFRLLQQFICKVLADVLDEEFPETVEERKAFLKRNHIALWDVLASCEIKGASDVSIRNAEPNDMNRILKAADIRAIFATGAKAAELYKKLCLPACGVEAIRLPSTSPANCGCSYEKLREAYSQICDYVR